MKEIIFGTTNEAKIKQIRGALAPSGIVVSGIRDKSLLPEVVEDGKTALENARIKSLAYAKALETVVFSMDNALYLDGLNNNEQPGLNVRRIKGFIGRPTDEQLLEYYSTLIAKLGGRINGYWEFGVCIADANGDYKETVIRSPRTFVSVPSKKIVDGYPLESIQIDPRSGKYISDMTQGEQDEFWQKAIGEPLSDFVQSVNL